MTFKELEAGYHSSAGVRCELVAAGAAAGSEVLDLADFAQDIRHADDVKQQGQHIGFTGTATNT